MSPNALTTLRILLTVPLFVVGVAVGAQGSWTALAIFLVAGLTDVLDGWLARRLGKTSLLGAMLDLMADRLLKLTAIAVLAADGALVGLWLLPPFILLARDLIVATLDQHLPGQLDIRVSPFERVKIAFQFGGLALLIAPQIGASHQAGAWALAISAVLACVTLVDYATRARRALAIK